MLIIFLKTYFNYVVLGFKKFLGVGTNIVKSLIFPRLQINKNNKIFLVNSKGYYSFWKRLSDGKYEQHTFNIFNKFLDMQHTYIDIGAWIGPTVLYGSQLAKHCYAIEPDLVAFQELKNNVEINKHLISKITISNLAISDSSGTIKLYKNYKWGNSESSIISRKKQSSIDVKTTTFQQFIQEYHVTDCNFIKMDIEGGEFVVLPTMFDYLKTNKPTLLLEIHPMFFDNPIQKLDGIRNVLNIYDHVYSEELKEIDIDDIFKMETDKIFRLILTPLKN